MSEKAAPWPPTWTPRRRRDWQNRGGTAQLAQAFWDAGWDAPSVLDATYSIEQVADLQPPTAPAWVHQALGDDLADLLREGAPALAEDQELACSRMRPDGTRELYEVLHDGRPLVVKRHAYGAGVWRSETLDGQHADLASAVRATPGIRQVGGDVVVRIFVYDEEGARRLVEHLEVTGPVDADRWPEEAADEWLEWDAELEADLPEVSWCPVWGRVSWLTEEPEMESSYHLRALSLQAGDQPLTVPVLVDDLPQVVSVETLAESSWFSESGGAPISWAGRNRLVRLRDNVVAASQSGDLGGEFDVWAVEEGDSMDSVIAGWAVAHDLEVVAAVHLAPLDPQHLLGGDDVRRWQELAAVVEKQTSFTVEWHRREALRAELARNSRYAQVARGLADPAGTAGQRLRAALEQVEETGVLGPFLQGEWDADNAPVDAEE